MTVWRIALWNLVAAVCCCCVESANVAEKTRHRTFQEIVAKSQRIALVRVLAVTEARKRDACGLVVSAQVEDDLRGGFDRFEFFVNDEEYTVEEDARYLVFASERGPKSEQILVQGAQSAEERAHWECVIEAAPFFVIDSPESLIPIEPSEKTPSEEVLRISRVSALTSNVDLPVEMDGDEGLIRWQLARARVLEELRKLPSY